MNHESYTCPPDNPSLNDEQRSAIVAINSWFFTTNEQFMILSGAGGCGKGHLLPNLVRNLYETDRFLNYTLEKSYSDMEVYITATQNDPTSELHSLGFTQAITIFKLLNLVLKTNDTTGEAKIVKGKNFETMVWNIQDRQRHLIIIDESSHISKNLFNTLQASKLRILFIGDTAQLRSVESSHFSVFDPILNIRSVNLIENNRATSKALKDLNLLLRNSVLLDTTPHIVPDNESVYLVEDDEFKKHLKHYSTTYQNIDHVKVLTYTNSASQDYNLGIRKWLNKPATPVVGDIIIANNQYSGNKVYNYSLRPSERLHLSDPYNDKHFKLRLAACYPSISDITILYVDTVSRQYKVPVCVFETPESRRRALDTLRRDAIAQSHWRPFYEIQSGILDYRFQHAETTHKAQGRTYEVVFVDLPDILTCHDMDTIRRLIYVSVSRARQKVFIRKPTKVS